MSLFSKNTDFKLKNIETGHFHVTYKGGSALYMADLLELNGKGRIHTIDLPENKEDASIHSNPRICVYKEGFMNYDTSGLSNYETILLIEDGSHLYKDTQAALNKFSPFVTKNSYFIAEDGIVTELGREKEFNGGPQKAVSEFLENNNNFIVDRKWCDFFGPNATFNVNGYLKRIS